MFAGHIESEFRNASFNQSRLIDQVQFVYQVTSDSESSAYGSRGTISQFFRTLTLRLPSRATVVGARMSNRRIIALGQ